MTHAHENTPGLGYYWEYLKRFGKESSEGWWKDFGTAIVLAIIPVLLAWGDRTVQQGTVLAVEAIGILFGIVALRHLIHTSFILFRERAHPEYGGIRYSHWGYGVWGAVILLALAVVIPYGAFHQWLRKLPPVVLQVPAPPSPTFTTTPIEPPESKAIRADKPPAPLARSALSTNAGAPSQTPPVAQSQPQAAPPPATFLDRIVQANRGLTPDDRNRLSTELYECDQFLKESQQDGYKLNTELGKLSNDRQSGALAKNVDDHIKFLQALSKSALDQYYGLQKLQAKWEYFPDQTEYVFSGSSGDAFNSGIGLLANAVQGMTAALTNWSKISNRDQQDVLNIEAQQQVDYEKGLRQFFDWANTSLQRIKQMRQSLDPNGVALEQTRQSAPQQSAKTESEPASPLEILTPHGGVDFTAFSNHLEEVINRNWYARMPEDARKGDKGRVVVHFGVQRDGTLLETAPTVEVTSGNKALDDAAVVAIRASAPFEHLPQSFKGPNIELRLNSLYNLPLSALNP
jgi:TonB family protein